MSIWMEARNDTKFLAFCHQLYKKEFVLLDVSKCKIEHYCLVHVICTEGRMKNLVLNVCFDFLSQHENLISKSDSIEDSNASTPSNGGK